MGEWKVCPYCNCEIPEACAFCPECGNKLPELKEPVYKKPQGVFCTSCGTYNEAGARFCEECGQMLEEVQDTVQNQWAQEEKEERRSHKGLIILIAAIVLVLGGSAAAGVFWWRTYQEEQESDKEKEDKRSADESEQDSEKDKEKDKEKDGQKPDEPESEEEKPEEKQEAYDVTEGGVHRYEYIVRDCTWEEAFKDCRERGGYMVRINSQAEFDYILGEITQKGYNKTQFFLGGKRTTDSHEYYWMNENGIPYGSQINHPSYWCQNAWMNNEPSFQDGDTQECCLNLFYYSKEGRWVLNDIPNDVLAVVPSFSGKIGYICEYE